MPVFDRAIVAAVLRVLEDRPVALAEAGQLLALVGSREEFLAHLLLRRTSFSVEPDITSAIRNAAADAGLEAMTQRTECRDAMVVRNAYNELEVALKQLILDVSQQSDRAQTKSRVEAAMRTYQERSLLRPVPGQRLVR